MNRIEHFNAQRRNESSVRSAMFIARHVPYYAKLRRSGMCGFNDDMPPRWGLKCFGDAVGYKHVAPLGLTLIPPGEILASLANIEAEIQQGMKELEGMLK